METAEIEALTKKHGESFTAYVSIVGAEHATEEGYEESYAGEYDSDEAFAQNVAEEIGAVENNGQWPNYCIDWEYASRELMMDYSEADGYYFRNI